MSLLSRIIEPNNLRLAFGGAGVITDIAQEIRDDARFARLVRHALFPPHHEPVPAVPDEIFPEHRSFEVAGLRGKRMGIVASGEAAPSLPCAECAGHWRSRARRWRPSAPARARSDLHRSGRSGSRRTR